MAMHGRPLVLAIVAALCAVALVAPSARAVDGPTLQKRLAAQSKKLGADSGAYVADITAGYELFSRNPDMRLAPASNEKLLTTAVALVKFGPTATLSTSVAAREAFDDDGTLDGDLYLVGGGDPTLGDTDLRALASKLRTQGLKKVTGSVSGDETAFDRLRGSFDSNFRPDYDLGGQLGALTWGHGSAHPGGPATVAAARLQKLLRARGVTFGRKARAAGATGAGPDATELATVSSPPMATLIALTNQPSDNFYAEMLVKDLGFKYGTSELGTTDAGLAVMRKQLSAFDVSATLRDGSGLSRADRTSPRQLVNLLRQMATNKYAAQFQASLAVPGRSGTLRHRMRGTAASRCRAKTGTLIGVSALSGYCTAANGHVIAFSFMENRVNASGAKAIENRMLPTVAGYSG